MTSITCIEGKTDLYCEIKNLTSRLPNLKVIILLKPNENGSVEDIVEIFQDFSLLNTTLVWNCTNKKHLYVLVKRGFEEEYKLQVIDKQVTHFSNEDVLSAINNVEEFVKNTSEANSTFISISKNRRTTKQQAVQRKCTQLY